MTVSDNQLLNEFVETGSEASFAELLKRYIHLVYSAAVRIIVDPHLAEDVTQSVFLALAQNARPVAARVGSGMPVAAWLHVTTRNLAAKSVRQEERRRTREKEATWRNSVDPCESLEWNALAPHLDAALGDLREGDRNLLLLRFFAEKSAREIGDTLGVNEQAAQKRVTRAIERLRQALRVRGVAPSAGGLAALLAANAVEAAPVSLAAGLIESSLGALPSAAATTMASLGPHAAASFAMSKVQILVLVALVLTFSVPLARQQRALAELRTIAARPVAPSAPLPAPAVGQGEDQEVSRLQRLETQLRTELAARRRPLPAKASNPGTLLLVPNLTVAVNQVVFAGNATPEAALQSFLFFQREANLDGALNMMLLPPADVTKMNEVLANDEARELMARQLREELYGLTISEAVQVDDQGRALSEPQITEVSPDNPTGQLSLRLLGKDALDERRVRLSVEFTRGNETKTRPFTFGLTPAGWKHIP